MWVVFSWLGWFYLLVETSDGCEVFRYTVFLILLDMLASSSRGVFMEKQVMVCPSSLRW